MPLHELITKLFPGESREDLSKIWKQVFSPELSSIMNRPSLDIIKLDDLLIAKYGQYKGSMKDFIKNSFGEDVFNAFQEMITF